MAYRGELPASSLPYFCVTGHRPDKLGGYDSAIQSRLVDFAAEWLDKIWEKEERAGVITGMALGWDMAVAMAADKLNLPYIAAVPFEGQHRQWPLSSQNLYERLLVNSTRQIEVFPPGYTAKKLLGRNSWMVDHSSGVLALWNGTRGGTQNCVDYAKRRRVPVLNVWDDWSK